MTNQSNNGNELIITRIFNAPPKLVWKAWTNPDHVQCSGGGQKVLHHPSSKIRSSKLEVNISTVCVHPMAKILAAKAFIAKSSN